MKTYLTPEDVNNLITHAGCQRNRILLLVLWTTGMRVSELISLKVEDFDPDTSTLIIRHLKSKNRKYRQVPLRKDVAKELLNFIRGKSSDDFLLSHSGPKKNDRRIFPLDRHTVNLILRSIAKDIGMDSKVLMHPESHRKHYISAHKFRDALAVHWLKTQPDITSQKALQSMLGHKNFDTTARYFKLSLDDVTKVYDNIWDKAEKSEGTPK